MSTGRVTDDGDVLRVKAQGAGEVDPPGEGVE